MIRIVDYGLGNVQAFINTFTLLGIEIGVARTCKDVEAASKLILPGVGSFDWAMARLNQSGMREYLDRAVSDGTPILGVCVGMQMMMHESDEGSLHGLGWVPGKVRKFDILNHHAVKLPHMGWNDVDPQPESGLFKGIDSPRFYFLHSYYVEPEYDSAAIARTEYGEKQFTSAIRVRNVYGCQFHPEKSHAWGTSLLKNFAEI